MKLEYNEAKNEANIRQRNLPFELARDFSFDTAIFVPDKRRDYGETRIIATGYIGGRLHVLCFKPIAPLHIRVISLRKANMRERKKYEKEA